MCERERKSEVEYGDQWQCLGGTPEGSNCVFVFVDLRIANLNECPEIFLKAMKDVNVNACGQWMPPYFLYPGKRVPVTFNRLEGRLLYGH